MFLWDTSDVISFFLLKKTILFVFVKKKQYLCNGNQMKTVKTLHFDFFELDVSFSLSFVSAFMWLAFGWQFVLSHMRTRKTTSDKTIIRAKRDKKHRNKSNI